MQDYTPGRVIRSLEVYRFLRMPLNSPAENLSARQKAIHSGVALEDQIDTLADIDRALCELDETAFVATLAVFTYKIPTDRVADALALPQSDVGDLCMRSVRNMARVLGWPGYSALLRESLIYDN